ncbi:hypothetical protein D3C71_1763540 [compost metagenome]
MAPAIWRTVLFTAVPCVPSCLGSAFSPAVLSGIVMKLNPIRRPMVRIIRYIYVVDSDRSVTAHIDGIINSKPIMNSGLAPKRSYNLPVTGDMNAFTSAPGSNSSPASNAVKPRPFCR